MWSAYTWQQNKATKEVRCSISDYYEGSIKKSEWDPKNVEKSSESWIKYIKSTVVPSIEMDWKLLTKQHDVLELLKYHFVYFGPQLASNIETRPNDNSLHKISRVYTKMQFKVVIKTDVLAAIDQLSSGKTHGSDKVTVTFVNDTKGFAVYPLMLIYNSSLTNSVFRDIWKLARVTPI